tara:strand:- start:134 stop:463 length:330 start_codon:yes stop_codon:yes gene_type:complete
MTRFLAAVVFLATFLYVKAAISQSPYCAEYFVLKNTINRQGEHLKFRGLSVNGQYLTEIFVNDTEGSDLGFTIIIRRATDDKGCVVFTGFGFDAVRGDTPWRVPQGEES